MADTRKTPIPEMQSSTVLPPLMPRAGPNDLVHRTFQKVVEGIEIADGGAKLAKGKEAYWASLPDEFIEYRVAGSARPGVYHLNNTTVVIDKEWMLSGKSPQAIDTYRQMEDGKIPKESLELLEAKVYSITQEAVDGASEMLIREGYVEVNEGDRVAESIVNEERQKAS